MSTDLEALFAGRPRLFREPTASGPTTTDILASVPPEEQESLLRKLGSRTLSALATVANVLTVPGASVVNLLGGEDPTAPWMNPTTSIGRLGGQGLATKMGFIDDSTNPIVKFLVGLLIDIPTDPVTWLGLPGVSALTKAGRLGKAAGGLRNIPQFIEEASLQAGKQLGKREALIGSTIGSRLGILGEAVKTANLGTMARPLTRQAAVAEAKLTGLENALLAANKFKPLSQELLKQPLATMGQFRVPLTDIEANLGVGASKFLAKPLDVAGNYLRYSYLGRRGAQLFQAGSRGASSAEFQQAMQRMDPAEGEALADAWSKTVQAVQLVKKAGLPEDGGTELLQRILEIEDIPGFVSGKIRPGDWITQQTHRMFSGLAPEQQESLVNAANLMREATATAHQVRKATGLASPELEDVLGMAYHPRYPTEKGMGGSGIFDQYFQTKHPSAQAREQMRKEFPEGTAAINRMTNDSKLVARDPAVVPTWKAREHIIDTYLMPRDARGNIVPASQISPQTLGQEAFDKIDKQATYWAETLAKFPEPATLYGNPVDSFSRYMQRMAITNTEGEHLAKFLAKEAVPLGPGVTDIEKILKAFSFTEGEELSPTALQNMADALTKRLGKPVAPTHVGGYGIPEKFSKDLEKMLGFQQPGKMKDVIQDVDSIVNMWKFGMTGANPAFHVRNLGSGTVQNILTRKFDPTLIRPTDKMLRAGTPVKGAENWPGVAQVLDQRGIPRNSENAFKVLQEFGAMYQLEPGFQSSALQGLPETIEKMAESMPGEVPIGGMDMLNALMGRKAGTTWNLSKAKMRGWMGETESTWAPMAAGEMTGKYVEGMNRYIPFFTLLKRGWHPSAAAQEVLASQVEYASRAFSPFEKSAMTRLFPFYKYGRRMSEFVGKELLERPQGGLAQTLRATRDLQGNQILPDYVGQGLAIPLPESWWGDANNPRFLSSLGLMHEQEPFGFMGGGLKGAGLEALSRLNPLIKVPIEATTGVSAFMRGPGGGRALEDMDPILGRTAANIAELAGWKQDKDLIPLGSMEPYARRVEALLGLAPLRMNVMRTFTDPRKQWWAKGINLLTGARLTDVSPQAIDAKIREEAAQALKDMGVGKQFTRTYVPKEVLGKLSAADRAKAAVNEAAMKRLIERAKRRALGETMPPILTIEDLGL